MPAVLIVDDQADVLDMLETLFTENGYSVLSASNCAVASDVTQRVAVDVAVIDCLLPKELGVVLATQLRDRGIPVIMMSGDHRVREQLEEAGLPLLLKPFKLDEALSAVGRLIKGAADAAN